MHWNFFNIIFFIFKIWTHHDFCHFLQLIFHFTLKSLNFSLHFLTNHMFRDIYRAVYIYFYHEYIFLWYKIWKLIHNNEELLFYCSYKNNQCITTLLWVSLQFFTLQVEKQGNKIVHFFLFILNTLLCYFSYWFFYSLFKILSLTSKKIVNLILVLFMIMKVSQF